MPVVMASYEFATPIYGESIKGGVAFKQLVFRQIRKSARDFFAYNVDDYQWVAKTPTTVYKRLEGKSPNIIIKFAIKRNRVPFVNPLYTQILLQHGQRNRVRTHVVEIHHDKMRPFLLVVFGCIQQPPDFIENPVPSIRYVFCAHGGPWVGVYTYFVFGIRFFIMNEFQQRVVIAFVVRHDNVYVVKCRFYLVDVAKHLVDVRFALIHGSTHKTFPRHCHNTLVKYRFNSFLHKEYNSMGKNARIGGGDSSQMGDSSQRGTAVKRGNHELRHFRHVRFYGVVQGRRQFHVLSNHQSVQRLAHCVFRSEYIVCSVLLFRDVENGRQYVYFRRSEITIMRERVYKYICFL